MLKQLQTVTSVLSYPLFLTFYLDVNKQKGFFFKFYFIFLIYVVLALDYVEHLPSNQQTNQIWK